MLEYFGSLLPSLTAQYKCFSPAMISVIIVNTVVQGNFMGQYGA